MGVFPAPSTGGGGPPSGPAGGVLSGVYPNPGFAVDMATQAELDAAVALLAPLASPALTGNPTVPTQTPGTNSTRAASTAYADTAVAVEAGVRAAADASLAPLASPALTGNPTVPTQIPGTNSTRAASTAYADTAVSVEATNRFNADTTLGALITALQHPAINAQTVSYQPVLADDGKIITMTAAGATVLTVPTNATVAFAVGASIQITRGGAGTVTITPAGGVTINSKGGLLTIGAQWTSVVLTQTAVNVWLMEGNVA